MSKQAELVIAGFETFAAGDWEGIAALYAGNARVTGPEEWPESGPFEGNEAVVGQFRRLAADWQQQRFTEVEVVAETPSWVVLSFTWETKGASSGIEVRFEMAAAYRVIDDRIAEAHFRWNPEAALAAAGLSG